MSHPYRWLLLIAALAALVYANALSDGFVYDDFDLIVHNNWVHEGNVFDAFRLGYWETSRGGSFYYRPIVAVSYWVDHKLWGDRPFGYHLRNVGLHVIVSVILLVLATRWLASWGAGLATAAIFAVHPIHTQSVTWIAGRTDLYAALFFLAALLFQQMAIDAAARILPVTAAAARTRAPGRFFPLVLQALSLLFLAAALMSKEMAVTYPAALMLHALFMTRGSGGSLRASASAVLSRWWLPLAASALLVALYLMARLDVVGHLAGYADDPHAWWTRADGTASRLLAVPVILAFYAGRLVFPWHIAFESGIKPVFSLAEPVLWASVAGLLALFATAYLLRRREPAVAFGLALFLLTLLPVMNIFPIFESAMEHFAYLPSAGFILAAVACGRTLIRPRKAQVAACCAVLGLLSARTLARNPEWKDEETFWHATVRESPSARAYNNLGIYLRDQGRLEEARSAFEEVLARDPQLPSSYANLGAVAVALGNRQEGINDFDQALKIDPGDADALYDLALTLETNAEGVRYGPGFPADQALATYTRLLEAHPDHAEGWTNLGVLQEKLGRPDEAARDYENAIRAAPDLPEPAAFLASILYNRGERDRAAEFYARYLELDPSGPYAEEARARSGRTAPGRGPSRR